MPKFLKRMIWAKNNVRIKGSGFSFIEPCEIGANTVIDAGCSVELEGNNKIGQNCTILSVSTITDLGKDEYRPVLLKWGSCVGANSVVRPGITIGKYSILAAGSVAICDIPDKEIWGGVPATFIKRRKRGVEK